MDRIKRITDMENALNAALALMARAEEGVEALEQIQPLIRKLDGYYSSPLWMQDYQADEQGHIPKDLPRGVLSEDGIYNLLFRYRQVLDQLESMMEE